MGTQVALEGYRRLPDRVAGLILVAGPYASCSTPCTAATSATGCSRWSATACRWSLPALPRLWGRCGGGRCPTLAGLARVGERADPEDMDGYFQHMARLDLPLVKVAEGMHRHRRRRCPTSGCRPWWWPAGATRGRRPPWPGRWPRPGSTPSCTLGEASHSLPIEEPDALEALVLGWLAERFPPRGGRGPAAQSGATG